MSVLSSGGDRSTLRRAQASLATGATLHCKAGKTLPRAAGRSMPPWRGVRHRLPRRARPRTAAARQRHRRPGVLRAGREGCGFPTCTTDCWPWPSLSSAPTSSSSAPAIARVRLFLGTGMVEALLFFGRQVGHTSGHESAAIRWWGWLGVWPTAVALALTTVSVLCFPDGRLPVALAVGDRCRGRSSPPSAPRFPPSGRSSTHLRASPLRIRSTRTRRAGRRRVVGVAHPAYAAFQVLWVVAVVARWRTVQRPRPPAADLVGRCRRGLRGRPRRRARRGGIRRGRDCWRRRWCRSRPAGRSCTVSTTPPTRRSAGCPGPASHSRDLPAGLAQAAAEALSCLERDVVDRRRRAARGRRLAGDRRHDRTHDAASPAAIAGASREVRREPWRRRRSGERRPGPYQCLVLGREQALRRPRRAGVAGHRPHRSRGRASPGSSKPASWTG